MDAIENKVEGEAAQDMMGGGGGGNQQQGGGGGLGGIENAGTYVCRCLLGIGTAAVTRERREGDREGGGLSD